MDFLPESTCEEVPKRGRGGWGGGGGELQLPETVTHMLSRQVEAAISADDTTGPSEGGALTWVVLFRDPPR